ncbi:hypothetical protein BDF19DRAFT_488412, partial [Syncephalis fuscata]
VTTAACIAAAGGRFISAKNGAKALIIYILFFSFALTTFVYMLSMEMDLTESIRIKVEEMRAQRQQRYDASCKTLEAELRRRTLQASQFYKTFEQAITQYQSVISLALEQPYHGNIKTDCDKHKSIANSLEPTCDTASAKDSIAITDLDSTSEQQTSTLALNDPIVPIEFPIISSSLESPICFSPLLDDTSSDLTHCQYEPSSIADTSVEALAITKDTVLLARQKSYRLGKEHEQAQQLVHKTKQAMRMLRREFQHELRELDRLEQRLCNISNAYEIAQKQDLTACLEDALSHTSTDGRKYNDITLTKLNKKRSFLSIAEIEAKDTADDAIHSASSLPPAKRSRSASTLSYSVLTAMATVPTLLLVALNGSNIYTTLVERLSPLLL